MGHCAALPGCRSAGLHLPASMPVLYEQQGGILEPEKMIAAHVQVAQYHGAKVHTGGQLLLPRYGQSTTEIMKAVRSLL